MAAVEIAQNTPRWNINAEHIGALAQGSPVNGDNILTHDQKVELNRFLEVSEPIPWGGEAGGLLVICRFKCSRLVEVFNIAPLSTLLSYYVWLRAKHVRRARSFGWSPQQQQRGVRYLVDTSNVRASAIQVHFITLVWNIIAIEHSLYPDTLHLLDFVNCSSSFAFVWASFSALLAGVTRKKIRLLSPNDESWRKELTMGVGAIDAALLPPPPGEVAWLGGALGGQHSSRALIPFQLPFFEETMRYIRQLLWQSPIVTKVTSIPPDAWPIAAVRALRGGFSAGYSRTVPLLHPEQLHTIRHVILPSFSTKKRRSSSITQTQKAPDPPTNTKQSPSRVNGQRAGSIADSVALMATANLRTKNLYGGASLEVSCDSAVCDSVTTFFKVTVTAPGQQAWTVRHRLFEFVELKKTLVELGIFKASEDWDRKGKLWDLPPSLGLDALTRGLLSFCRATLVNKTAAGSYEVNAFLGNIIYTADPDYIDADDSENDECDSQDGSVTRHGEDENGAFDATQNSSFLSGMWSASGGHYLSEEAENDFLPIDAAGGMQEGRGTNAYLMDSATEVISCRLGLRPMVRDAADSARFRVRGKHYYDDRHRKIRTPGGPAVCELLHVDLFKLDEAAVMVDHIALHGKAASAIQSLQFGGENAPFLFILQFQIPASERHPPLSLVCYWGLPPPGNKEGDENAAEERLRSLLLRYAELPLHPSVGGCGAVDDCIKTGRLPKDDFRNERLKAHITVKDGPSRLRKFVGGKEARTLSHMMTVKHFRGVGYIESDVDIGSSHAVPNIVSHCLMVADTVAMDIGIVIEGRESSDLPEVVLGAFHLSNIDIDVAEPLYQRPSSGLPLHPEPIFSTLSGPSALLGLPFLRKGLWGKVAAASLGDSSSKSLALRGDTYVDEGGDKGDKQKIPPGAPLGQLIHVELYSVTHIGESVDHICLYEPASSVLQLLRERVKTSLGPAAEILVINVQVLPESGAGGGLQSLVCYWAIPSLDPTYYSDPKHAKAAALAKLFFEGGQDPTAQQERKEKGHNSSNSSVSAATMQGVSHASARQGSMTSAAGGGWAAAAEEEAVRNEALGISPPGDYRTERLKLLCSVEKGLNFFTKKLAGWRPVLTGRKLRQRCFRGQDYLEIDVEAVAPAVHTRIGLSQLMEKCADLVVVIGWALEARTAAELPEQLLGAVRLHQLDLQRLATPLAATNAVESTVPMKAGAKPAIDRVNLVEVNAQKAVEAVRAERARRAAILIQGDGEANIIGLGHITSPSLRGMFADGGSNNSFSLRGPKYMADKLKIPAGPALSKLLRVDLFNIKGCGGQRADHICSLGRCKRVIDSLLKRDTGLGSASQSPGGARGVSPAVRQDKTCLLFVMNFQAPTSPPISLVCYFGLESLNLEDYSTEEDKQFISLIQRYMDIPQTNGPYTGLLDADDFRNQRFKILPLVREGPWLVKAATGSTPTLLGRKLTQRYYKGDGYIETCVDIGSSAIASQVVGVCIGHAKNLTIDVGVTLEGRQTSELPERLLGCVTIRELDTTKSLPLFPEGAV